MNRIAFFASGSGTNVENIAKAFSQNERLIPALVVCNKADAGVLDRAKRLGIKSLVIDNAQANDGAFLRALMQKHQIDFIVLAGYLRKIPPELIAAYPKRILNIHPALLPKFGGKGMYGDRVHEAVIAKGEAVSGITIHFVDEAYDEGDVVFQAQVKVEKNDTAASLAKKIHQLEYQYFPEVIAKWISE